MTTATDYRPATGERIAFKRDQDSEVRYGRVESDSQDNWISVMLTGREILHLWVPRSAILGASIDPNAQFYRAMISGHLERKGHMLEAYYGPGEIPSLIRSCCGEVE